MDAKCSLLGIPVLFLCHRNAIRVASATLPIAWPQAFEKVIPVEWRAEKDCLGKLGKMEISSKMA